LDNHKQRNTCDVIRKHVRITHHVSRTLTLLFILVGVIAAVAACNTSPTPAPTATTQAAALLPESTSTVAPPSPAAPTQGAYPAIVSPPLQSAYPPPTAYPEEGSVTAVPPQPTLALTPSQNGSYTFLPLITNLENLEPPPETAVLPEPSPSETPTPIPIIDFAAVKADLNANGQEIGYTKIGFHVGIGGNTEGLEEWMRDLDAAGVPFFLKSVDNAQPIYIAQELMKESGVPHTLVFRKASGGTTYNLPNYDLPPAVAAQEHWQIHRDDFPPELDPNLVWFETVNEVDKNRSEWLAQFAIETAKLTMQDGYRWAAFGWSSGEPEPEQWQGPYMLEFLRMAGQNPDRLAIALHEYSYLEDDISHIYPYKIGRFQELFRIVDSYGIPRPTVLITEWGWSYEHVPDPGPAIEDIAWASALYAPYPEVKGAAIWYLGMGDTFGDIANEAQRLIDPLRVYALTHYFVIPLPPDQQPINPEQHQP
jgi:hypothetical protein